jgi:hypothetical protein
MVPILEYLKQYAERAAGIRRPGRRKAPDLAQAHKPHAVRFKDDGLVPNHPRWPLIIYRSAVDLDERHDAAAVIEDLFEANGWGDTWRDGIYDHVHYHSRIHEALGIARGKGARPIRRQDGPNLHVESRRRRCPAGRHWPPVPVCVRRLPSHRRLPAGGYVLQVYDPRRSSARPQDYIGGAVAA